ncbi:hypothetical protein AMATHDRAFT_147198 [Amanita thiersii Skay4041]|uniref:Vta1/callose synthase N-terminal domain-containing protein n=1 Tax=Amanita thiersii Skay4041 TaxID=703135 RepID=A0A2A9NK28_9AGAR|nr:hypothetical protein AMATHDRAFT_147198 [Amanita thiersii Skay4041]
MSAHKLALPPISPELKSIAPYIQRADELLNQDPIIAYWSAYYAAQLGISQKVKDVHSRQFLFSLLDLLEKMKADIGPNDAITNESASCAYVENFALRVFAFADNDDRKGNATKATAMKFLAAANFLEILRTFPRSEVSDANEEKIRYAKWKAADISKALREGRQPTPGSITTPDEPLSTSPAAPGLVPSPHHHSHDTLVKADETAGPLPASGDGQPHLQPPMKKAWVSEELEGNLTPASMTPPRESHISPSPDYFIQTDENPSTTNAAGASDIEYGDPFEPPERLTQVPLEPIEGGLSPDHPYLKFPPPPLPFIPSPPYLEPPPPPSVPSTIHIEPSFSVHSPVPEQPSPLTPGAVLTPSLITKVQRHCRFAISALDYEDAEQARKELRAALAALGG